MRNFYFTTFLLLSTIPLLLGVGYALLYSLGLVGLIDAGLTFGHWEAVVTAPAFWHSLAFSAYAALASMVLALAISLPLVIRWHRDLREGRLSYVAYLPLALPPIVAGFIAFQLLSQGGWVSRLSYQLGLTTAPEQFPGLVNDPYGIGIILAHGLMAAAFFTILFANLYHSERLPELQGLAATLGARPGQVTWRVTLPVLLRRARPTLLLYFLFVMSAYEVPLLLGSQARPMIAVLTIRKLQRFNLADIPQAYTISVVYTVVVAGFLVLALGRRDPS